MPRIIVKKPFKFAHEGHRVEEFEPSKEPRETSEECADIAIAEGWAKRVTGESAAERSAPEAAAESGAPETKADAA